MKKNLILSLFVFLCIVIVRDQTFATITTAPLQDVQKVTLDHGISGVFCQVNSPDVTANKLLTIYEGDAPADYYSTLYQKATCSSDSKNFIIGNVTLNYFQGYFVRENFVITDDKMYRAGGQFYSYYKDTSQGGTYTSSSFTEPLKGLEVIGSNYFFKSEYDADASSSARLEDMGYINHFAIDGSQDWTLLVFQNQVYKLKEIIKEEKNITLLDNTPEAQPIPSVTEVNPTNTEINLSETPKPIEENTATPGAQLYPNQQ